MDIVSVRAVMTDIQQVFVLIFLLYALLTLMTY
jgi:hypothetical protein